MQKTQTENNNTPAQVEASTQPTTTTDGELQLLAMYRALPDGEQQRVWNAALDAGRRCREPKLAASYDPIERFIDWLLSTLDGEHVEQICFTHDITPRQHRDYIKAYVILAGIHAAAEARFLLVNGSDGTEEAA